MKPAPLLLTLSIGSWPKAPWLQTDWILWLDNIFQCLLLFILYLGPEKVSTVFNFHKFQSFIKCIKDHVCSFFFFFFFYGCILNLNWCWILLINDTSNIHFSGDYTISQSDMCEGTWSPSQVIIWLNSPPKCIGLKSIGVSMIWCWNWNKQC